MRILHVTPYFEHAWAYGGVPRAATATVRALAARGHHVAVCTTDAYRPDERLGDRAPVPGRAPQLDVRVFPNVSNTAAYRLQCFLPRGMNAHLRTHAASFDIAHVHACHNLPGVLAARHLRRAGVPYVVTTHGTAPYLERRRTAKRFFDLTVGRGFLEGAARVIAVSRAERAQLVQFGVAPDLIRVVPNPIELSEFVPTVPGAFRRRVGIPADVPLVLFLGKLTAQKRLDILVEAFASLEHRDAVLVIAGNDMGYLRTLRQLIDRFGIRERTVLAGLLSGSERLCAYSDAQVVAYPSEGEVFGLAPVEALLCGTPVVVSNDSGCGEVVHTVGGGLLVEPGHAERLRKALACILDEPAAWRSRAADARIRVRRYASDDVSVAIEEVYDEVLATAGASRQRPAV